MRSVSGWGPNLTQSFSSRGISVSPARGPGCSQWQPAAGTVEVQGLKRGWPGITKSLQGPQYYSFLASLMKLWAVIVRMFGVQVGFRLELS